jgi:formylglycine-generating enzyme required for sulfatase activity
MNASRTWVSVCLVIGLLECTVSAVNIETVPVGNVGNAGEVQSQGTFGAVNYTYNIGKFEVTAGQYTEFLNAVAKTDTYALYSTYMWSSTRGCKIQQSGSSGNYTYSVASDYANRPVNYVSWGDSARFANWLHNGQPTGAQGLTTTEDGAYYLNGATSDAALLAVNRESDWKWAITSEDEWYKAAYHKNDGVTGNYWDYPTSSDTVPGRDLDDVSGNNANYKGDPYPIQSPYYTTVAGEFQNSDSPYGTFDQGGNVWEWNEAIVGSSRGLRGASFGSFDYGMPASYRNYNFPSNESEFLGFRVSAIPEPSTAVLVLMGGGACLLWRRRKVTLTPHGPSGSPAVKSNFLSVGSVRTV